jgi:hypothetical protein
MCVREHQRNANVTRSPNNRRRGKNDAGDLAGEPLWTSVCALVPLHRVAGKWFSNASNPSKPVGRDQSPNMDDTPLRIDVVKMSNKTSYKSDIYS